MRSTLLAFSAAASLGILSAACASSSTEPSNSADTIVVSPPAVSLVPHDSVRLDVGVLDADGKLLTGVPVAFHSGDTSVVVVSPLGWVRSVGKTGLAVVTVSGAGLATAVAVQVVAGGGGGGGPGYDTTALRRIALPGAAFGVAASPGGAVYATLLYAAGVARVDAASDTVLGTISVGSIPTDVVFNPSGTRAYVSNQFSSTISVIDTVTRTVVDIVPVRGDPTPMAVSADGQALFVATNADSLYKLDLTTHAVLAAVPLPATAHHAAMNPSRSKLYVATRDGGTVMEIDAATMAVLRTFIMGGRTQGLVVTPDDAELWVANEFGSVQVWRLSDGTFLTGVPATYGFGLAQSTDGTRIFVSSSGLGTITVIDRASRAITKTIVAGGTPRIVAFEPVTGKAIVANEGGWLDIVR